MEVIGALAPVAEISVRQPTTSSPGPDRRDWRRFGVTGWLGSRRPSTLIAYLAVFTMGPLILLSTLIVNSTYSTLTAASKQRLSDGSALAAVYVNKEMTGLLALTDSYARRQVLIAALRDGNHANYDSPAILAVMRDLRGVQDGTRFACVTDASGTLMGEIDPPTPAVNGQNFGYRDWFQGVVRTGKPYVSAAYASAVQGAPLVVGVAVPVKADGQYAPVGKVVGYLLVGYLLSSTQSLFSEFALDQGVKIEVTDQHGVVVAQSGAVPTTLVQDDSAGVAGALTGRRSVDRANVGGQDVFAAYSPVADVGWTVVARVPISSARADANRLSTSVVAITLVLFVVLAITKAVLYVVLRDRQAAHLDLASVNSRLEERVVARTAELEASNRELEAFSYSVSHDLRAPLRSIDGFSRLVLDENRAQLSPESARRLDLVRAGAQQMGYLIDDLLSFSRLGRVELKKRRVHTAAIVNEVIAELKLQNPNRQIEFVMQDLPACYADPNLLKQVFRNLLANAVKFTGKRPTARIEVASLVGSDPTKPRMVTYFVKDDGAGYDMRYSDKLFGVFQRLHRSEDFPGTGVGLALVKRIVERHGGKVWTEGAVDAGATFYLSLEADHA
jgi:signal transduction histidine kinase